MGEQLSDGGAVGRRSAHPGGPDLETLLAAAMRSDTLDAEGERRAVAAFREARDAGAHRAAPGAATTGVRAPAAARHA
ncbi:hypothetical protein GA0115233_103771, partial [Streptomyces sp. DI166]